MIFLNIMGFHSLVQYTITYSKHQQNKHRELLGSSILIRPHVHWTMNNKQIKIENYKTLSSLPVKWKNMLQNTSISMSKFRINQPNVLLLMPWETSIKINGFADQLISKYIDKRIVRICGLSF